MRLEYVLVKRVSKKKSGPNLGAAVAAFLLVLVSATVATPEFRHGRIRVGGVVVNVEIADDGEKRYYGLRYRTRLAPDSGMIFIFDAPPPVQFTMKDTRMSLSVAFFDASRKITEVMEMKKGDAATAYRPRGLVQYALEMEPGWFAKRKIEPGASFDWIRQRSD